MSFYTHIPRESFVRGALWNPAYQLTDRAGNPIDLTGKKVIFRWTLEGASTPALDRDTDTADETYYPEGDGGLSGQVGPLVNDTDSWAVVAGIYILEILYIDTATNPDEVIPWGIGIFEVESPPGGQLNP